MANKNILEYIRGKDAFISDMDGVLYHGNRLLDGAKEFIEWLKMSNKKFLFLTNSPERSPQELSEKLARLGVEVEPEHFYTSAQATASFLASQKKKGSVYAIGEAGLINAIYNIGWTMNDINPDYVIIGEGRSYTFEVLIRATNLVRKGAKLIGTNPDTSGPIENGIIPATGALAAPIELATGKKCYFIGKPNPLIMRHALKQLNSPRENTVIIGDRMDTDILAGIESEIDTVLVLSGVSTAEDVENFAYTPKFILAGVKDIIPN